MFRKGDIVCTDNFDVVVSEIASTEVTMSGVEWVVEITTKQGKVFYHPEPPLKTQEEAIDHKKKLRDDYFW